MDCLLVINRYSRESIELLTSLIEIKSWLRKMNVRISCMCINGYAPTPGDKKRLSELPTKIQRVPTLISPQGQPFIGMKDITQLFRKNIQDDRRRKEQIAKNAYLHEPDDVERYMHRMAHGDDQEDLQGEQQRMMSRVSEATARRQEMMKNPQRRQETRRSGYEDDYSDDDAPRRKRGRGRGGRTRMPDSDDEDDMPRRGRGRNMNDLPTNLEPGEGGSAADDALMRQYLENHSGEGFSP